MRPQRWRLGLGWVVAVCDCPNGSFLFATRSKKLLGAPGIATRSDRTLLGAKGIATRSKDEVGRRGEVVARYS